MPGLRDRSHEVSGLVRDRITWLTYSQMALFAWFMYGLGATIALVRDEQGTSRTLSGLHGTALAAAGIIAGLTAAGLIGSVGRGRLITITSLGTCLGVLLYITPDGNYPVTMAAVFGVGLVGSLLIISLNAFLLEYHGPFGAASLTEANALASLVGLVSPLVIGLCAATFLGWRAGMLVMIIGLLITMVMRMRTSIPGGGTAPVEEDRRTPMPKGFGWSMALVMCFLGSEFALVFWTPDLLRERGGFSAAAAAASLGAITAGMAAGRLLGSRLTVRFATDALLKVSTMTALVGFIVTWAVPNGAVIVIGLGVTGLGLGVLWPLGLARAVAASGGRTNHAAARAGLATSISLAVAPFALGFIADLSSLHTALLLVAAMLITALIILQIRPVSVPIPQAVARG